MNAESPNAIEQLTAQQQLQLSDFVFEHSSEAIMITDSNNRIIAINKAFEKLTGYRSKELLGKDPVLFSSGKHDAHFYRHMWKDLIQKGSWQGELYHRRKNGEIFPAELSLNVVKDIRNVASNYVGILRDISSLKDTEQKLAYYTNNDSLTGLPNRGNFITKVEQHISIAKRHNAPFSILFLNIDHFKEINDIHGHYVGDLLLQGITTRLVKIVRNEDIISRYGSDEFAILLVNALTDRAVKVAEKIQAQLRESFVLEQSNLEITCSIGITDYPKGGRNTTTLMRNAQHAMQGAKSRGRNSFAFYDKKLQMAYLRKLALRNKLKRAIQNSEFEVYYQPIVEQPSQQANKFEALVRWRDSNGDFISPGEFIPVAEEFDMICQIGNFVLLQACKDLKRLYKLGHNNVRFSINRSISEFRYDVDEASIISKTIEQFGLPYDAIVIEVTESVAMSSNTHTEQALNALRETGVKIALDDFCTGYSSLSNLIEYKSDYLKIDKSFIDSIVSDKNHQILVSTLINLASKLDMQVIAEGVETADQLAILTSFGCHYIQGFYYSPAVPIDKCIELVKAPMKENT